MAENSDNSPDHTRNSEFAENGASTGTLETGHRSVPALPPSLADPTPVVLVGTLLWFISCAVFGAMDWIAGEPTIRFWTSLAGTALGVLGYVVFRWQRAASRRGSRGAWRGLSGLDG